MARCSYQYTDGARCMYADHRLADGAVCDVHLSMMSMAKRRQKANRRVAEKRKAQRMEARR